MDGTRLTTWNNDDEYSVNRQKDYSMSASLASILKAKIKGKLS